MPSSRRAVLAALAAAAGCTDATPAGDGPDDTGTAPATEGTGTPDRTTTTDRTGTPEDEPTSAPDAPAYAHWSHETPHGALGTLSLAPGADGPAVYAGSDGPGDPGATPADGAHALYAISLPEGSEQWRVALPAPVRTAPVPGGHGGPDRLYLSTGPKQLREGGWTLHAVDYAAGEHAWAFDPGDRRYRYPLAADDTGVFVGCRDDQVEEGGESAYALAAADGDERWRADAGDVEPGESAVRRGRVFVSSPRTLRALEAGTGDERWRFEGDERLDGPAYDNRAERVFVGHDDAVHALAHDDGAELWRREFDGWVSTVTSPREAMDETVFVGGGDGRMVALSPLDGETRWTLDVGDGPFYPSVDRTSETLYVGGAGVRALDPVSGEQRWAYTPDVDGRVDVHASTGVFASVHGEFVAALDPATGAERWRFAPDGALTGPATAGDVAVVGVDGTVHALDGSHEG